MSVVTTDACKLSSYSPLEGLVKQRCLSCGRHRMYFCYDCRIILPGVPSPRVKLPCDVDVIKHPMEKNGKSSAIHCKILAPEQTRIFDIPNVFEYNKEDKEKHDGIVFASPSSVSIEEFVKAKGPIKRFIVLDCTWYQVNTMLRIPQIQGLPYVSLTKYHTAFWRPQHNVGQNGLATIEAIYYALREYQEYGLQRPYKGLNNEGYSLPLFLFHFRQYV
uniref:tRNA-uridine aminocarboxypropyltransferase 1 n=1 Tax=Angiostrongylus cantonensis TaxID=6313 RepID=A0A0K0D591_ANGCA